MNKAAPRIILVDDNQYDRDLIRECLQSENLQATFIEMVDGEQAINFFSESSGEDFDIVLLDVRMPHKNGFQVLSAIREHNQIAAKPVVIISAFDLPASQKYHPNEFWSKPFDLDGFHQLAGIIKDLLQQSN